MKISKLLNKKNLSIIFILFMGSNIIAEEQPVDIWNIEKKKNEVNKSSNELVIKENSKIRSDNQFNIYNMQSQKENNKIQLNNNLKAQEIKIYGLFDPEDYDLQIDMWLNSNGNQLKNIFSRLNRINLSDDATEIMNIVLLTNAHPPKINISEAEFLNLKIRLVN